MKKKIIVAGVLVFLINAAFAEDKVIGPPQWQAKTFCLLNGYTSLKSEALKIDFFGSISAVYQYCTCVIPLSVMKYNRNRQAEQDCGGSLQNDEKFSACMKSKTIQPKKEIAKFKLCQPLIDKFKKITD